jgi:NAD(P)-dependent dehydrogenase (short-subunit alcohol dehydrogenase family)
MTKQSGSARPLVDRKKKQKRRAPKSTSVANSNSPADFASIAEKHLGTSAPANDLRGLASLVAGMRRGEALGGKGSEAARKLSGAGKAVAVAAKHLRGINLLALIEAMRRPAKGETTAPSQATINDLTRMAVVERLGALMVELDRLAEGLTAAAQQVPRLKRKLSPRSGLFGFALEALEHIWWRYRFEVPTWSTATGGFTAFAQDMLTSPPCSFATSSVKTAVREYLKDETRPALQAARSVAVVPEAPRSALVIGADSPVLGALARHYAEAGTRVVATAAPERVAAVQAKLGEGIAVVPLSLLRVPTADDLVALGKGKHDVMVIGGLTGLTGVIEPMGADDFERVDPAGRATAALQVPTALQALMQAMRRRRVLRKGARVVVIASHLASAAKGRLAGGYAATPAYAAIQTLVGLWARDLGGDDVTVVSMHPGWGQRDDGTPNRHTLPATTARVMGATIGRLGPREHGELIDLNGSIEPR